MLRNKNHPTHPEQVRQSATPEQLDMLSGIAAGIWDSVRRSPHDTRYKGYTVLFDEHDGTAVLEKRGSPTHRSGIKINAGSDGAWTLTTYLTYHPAGKQRDLVNIKEHRYPLVPEAASLSSEATYIVDYDGNFSGVRKLQMAVATPPLSAQNCQTLIQNLQPFETPSVHERARD